MARARSAHRTPDGRPAPPAPSLATDGRRRRGEDTRARIMAAAAELFAAHGFDATSTQAIAAASGITVAAIYRHFPGKAELLVAVAHEALGTTFAETITGVGPSTVDQQVADIAVAYTEPGRRFTRRLVVELTHAAASHPEVATSLQAFHERARRHIADLLRSGQRDGTIDAGVDAGLAARDVLLLIMGICHIDTLDPGALADVEWHRTLRRTVHATIGSGAAVGQPGAPAPAPTSAGGRPTARRGAGRSPASGAETAQGPRARLR